jgi:outer membrane murein-binding lipoprotein Lpp
MLQTHRSVLYAALAGLLLLSGCRTYGGYDTKPKTYAAMQKAVHSFEADLKRTRTDLQALEQAATEADTLQSLAEEFQSLVDEHNSLLETQRDRVERLGPDATYRNLHRAYGATVTEQRLMRQKYQRVIRTVHATVQDTVAHEASSETDRQYTIRPIGFPSSEDGKPLSMEEALRGL